MEPSIRDFVAFINDGTSRRDGPLAPFLAMSATFPSLLLSPPLCRRPVNSSEDARTLALRCLSRPVLYGPSSSSSPCDLDDISRASQRMVTSLASSFEGLVRSCLRNYTKRQGQLWQHQHQQRRRRRRGRGQQTAVVPPRAEAPRLVVKGAKGASFVVVALLPPRPSASSGRCELPIRATFRFEIDWDGAKGTMIEVEARGTIVGSSSSPDLETLGSVVVTLDCPALLLSLRQAARLAAYRLVTRQTPPARLEAQRPTAAAPRSMDEVWSSSETGAAAVTPCSSPLPPPLSLPFSSSADGAAAAAEDHEDGRRRRRPTMKTLLLPPKKRIRRIGRAVSPSPPRSEEGQTGGRR